MRYYSNLCTVLILLIVSMNAFSQVTTGSGGGVIPPEMIEQAEIDIKNQNETVEQIISDTNNLRLPENRAYALALLANKLWTTDEKKARQIFGQSVEQLILAQQEIAFDKDNLTKYAQLFYGQTPRQTIIELISTKDAELALKAFVSSRPKVLSDAIPLYSNGGEKDVSGGSVTYDPLKNYAIADIQHEIRYEVLAAQQNPENSVEKFRESLKKGVTYQSLDFIRNLFGKDPELAQQLAEEITEKLLQAKFNQNDNNNYYMIQNFLATVGQEAQPNQKVLRISDKSMRALAEKILDYWEEMNTGETNSYVFKMIEKFYPARAAKIRKFVEERQKLYENYSGNDESKRYAELMKDDLSAEELIEQAEKFSNYKSSVYSNAVQKYKQNGDLQNAVNLITTKYSGTEINQQLSSLYAGFAYEAITKGNYDEANLLIEKMPDEDQKFDAWINFASSVYQKDRKENKDLALSYLDKAFQIINPVIETNQQVNQIMTLAAAYVELDADQSFSLIGSVIPAINEYTNAIAVISKFNNDSSLRKGEYQLTNMNNIQGSYNLNSTLSNLKTRDFQRTRNLINRFDRTESRIFLKINLIQEAPSDSAIRDLPVTGRTPMKVMVRRN